MRLRTYFRLSYWAVNTIYQINWVDRKFSERHTCSRIFPHLFRIIRQADLDLRLAKYLECRIKLIWKI